MIDPLRPDSGAPDGWAAARAQDCRGRGRIPALRRRGTAAIAAPNQKGAGAEGGAVRPHNRRLVGVLSRRRGRSSILGDYRASAHLGSWLGECRPGLGGMRPAVLCGIASPSPVPSLSRLSAPTRSHPKKPPRSSPPCLRAARCPPPNGPVLPRAKSRGRGSAGTRWRVRSRPPRCPRAALSGTALLRINGEELTAAGQIDQAAGQIDHPPDDAAGGLHEAAARAVEVARSTPHPEPPASASRVMLACPAVLLRCRRPPTPRRRHASANSPKSRQKKFS